MTYDKMGNITTLQRQGKLDSGYGIMDNLTYDYLGNQLTKVTDAATPAITYPGAFHFVDGANTTNEYTYDANGNLTKDLNKNITQITYNVLNLPKVVTFGNANTITYAYDGAGNKLSVAYKAGTNIVKTDYVSNKVYKNGTLSMLHTEEGYITFSGATPIYHYYLKDHQGNNRVVMNQNGAIEQVNHYYPFGGLFGEGLQTSNQPYKYNGKELDRFEGLDMYDYGARMYDAARGGWGTVDNKAEKYYFISPYVYAINNPVFFIDPDGNEVIAHGKIAQRNILNTLPKNVRSSMKFKKDGSLTIISSKSVKTSISGNLKSLQTLNNSNTKYHFRVASKYTDGNGITNKLVGDNVNGTKGVTLIPNGEAEPSPDSDVHIYTSESLSEERQAINTAHEGYAHGLSYEEGKDPYHRYKGVAIEDENGNWAIEREETNIELKEKYKVAEEEAKKNYNKIK